jgi:hypothetical protein
MSRRTERGQTPSRPTPDGSVPGPEPPVSPFPYSGNYVAAALFRAGVNPRVVQELLGHADLTTTMRYAHVEANDLKHGIARLETFVARHSPEEPPPDSGTRPHERPRKKVA